MKNLEKYNVICLSNQLWDFPNWTNKKHVMSRLAKLGHKVLFVDPPINTGFVFFRQIKRGLWNMQRFINRYVKDFDGNVLVFTPLNLVPVSALTSLIHISRIRYLAKRHFDSSNKTILWVYHVQIPQIEKYIKYLNYDLLVYDCVDNYEAFPEQGSFYRASSNISETLQNEDYLAAKADLVFASAPGLVEKLKKFNNKVYFTPNVGNYKKFKNAQKYKYHLPSDIRNISSPRIGFIGALDDYKFDYKLFKSLVETYPDYSFVLIGSMAIKDKNADLHSLGLTGYKNVHLLGSKPYDEIEKYMGGFDVFIIPYVLNDYTVGGCFPVKFHEGLAAGVPVVVTDLPAYYPFDEVCYISKNDTDFVENIKKALSDNSAQKMRERQIVAKENDWDGKVQRLLGYIQTSLS
ncbi:MAG: glycosyltransferase [Patescibacteria group bacterium]